MLRYQPFQRWLMPTKISTVHLTSSCPFQGWFAIHGQALATFNQHTKFEVSNSTHYADIKSDIESRKWVVWVT